MERVVVDLVEPPSRWRPDVIYRSSLDVVVLVAAAADVLTGPVGVWLSIGDDYPAALAARDLKTLSHLVTLAEAVLDGPQATDAVDLVGALLDGGPVTTDSPAGVLREAYSLPVPPRPVALWRRTGDHLVGAGVTLDQVGEGASRYAAITPAAG